MNILREFREVGYFTSDLYHLLTEKKPLDPLVPRQIIPSEYVKELRMSCAERLQKLNGISIDNLVTTGKAKKPVLAFTPPLIVFQNYKPNERIIAKFSVKNISNGPTYLNMVFKESSNFFIKPLGGELLSRLAPGISVTFAITFLPIQYEDYIHRVTFLTDTDQYVVPLIGIGPRPIFDFPDEIVIPKTPLKVETSVLVTVHNIGVVPAGFVLNAKTPFYVHPKSVFLNPNCKVELKVGFKTMRSGESTGNIYPQYETGETFNIRVKGTTYTIRIELEKAVVRFLDTYNTMVRQQTFKVTNKSNDVISYVCMKNDCIFKDFEDKMKLATIFYDLKDSEAAKYRKLEQYDVLSSDEHERVYTRIFYDEIQSLVADESLFFQDPHFSITPFKGKLWPNKKTELTITFSPKEIGDFTAIAFLDVDGVLDRIPLQMHGTSLPPEIRLNLETLDMTDVYINTQYNYEIVAINKGHINGVIVYKESPPLFGSIITVTPEMHCLEPGHKETFTVSFSNSNQGPYFEELIFSIRDTDIVRKLYLKGEVIYPSLFFSIPCLDFDRVSVGVPKTLQVEVINESGVTVAATVKISSDGPEISSFTLEDCDASESLHFDLPVWPKEFNIEPNKIELEGRCRVTLKVTLTANLVRANHTSLDLELDKSDSPPISLPVIFEAHVPEITPAPDIKLRACFIDYVYNYDIVIQSNEFWGFFTIEPQDENETIRVDVSIKRGIIRPNSTITLPASMSTSVLGNQQHTLKMNLFGLSKPIEICHVQGRGVRPIITCTPMALQWGQVKLLTKSQKILTLCNDSPVTVNYKASLLSRDTKWTIEPDEGHIDPESEIELILYLYLVDSGSYTNKALLQFEKVKDILVPLSATGVGTSIVIGPDRDRVNMNRHFIKIPLDYTVVMENCGTRLHSLEWVDKYKAPKGKYNEGSSFFTLEPSSFKIQAGEKIDLKITAMPLKVCVVKEHWFLVGSVEGVNKKELLLTCLFQAEFVEPKIIVSASQIEFRYDCGPYSEYYKLTDILTIKNVSNLPLDLDISLRPPFAMIQKQGTYKIDPDDDEMCCCISYNEMDLNVNNIIKENGYGQSKIYIDCLTLRPLEPLRREPLNFFEDINKIKMAFNLTHNVEERLEDQDVMKIQILFDTTKHQSLKSKTYYDQMKLKFRNHKNKDNVKLSGKINFPNLFIMTPKLDFQCILNGTIESKTFQVHNPTPLTVCFKFKWKKCTVINMSMPEFPNIEYDVTKLSRRAASIESLRNSGDFINIATNETDKMKSLSVVTDATQKDVGDGDANAEQSLAKSKDVIDDNTPVINPLEEERTKKLKIMRKIVPMLKPIENSDSFNWMSKFQKKILYKKMDINDIFQIVPHRGKLKPDDTVHVHVIFRPKPNIDIRAVLECEVLGGPSEFLTITGQSSDLMFSLSSQTLNFKIRSFHENAIEYLVISNLTQLPLSYTTYLNEPIFETELPATIIRIDPPGKTVEVEGKSQVGVVMRPGVIGYFHRVFLLEIGFLPHIPIEVYGWGVIPQVYLSLPRPELLKLSAETGYNAIAGLTREYLEAVKEIFTRGVNEHMNSPLSEKCFEDPELQESWHICSAWDGYPSSMDIDLAIERTLVLKYIKSRPDILTMYATTSKMTPIPGFTTIPYVVDFGVVITGSTVLCTVEIVNYGPLTTKLRFVKNTVFPFWLSMKLCGKLNPGETGKMDISFTPLASAFPELEQDFETSFQLEMPYSVIIPIKIKALCAVPYLKSNVDKIDFGFVRCGDKIVHSIALRNVGKPTCIWYVTLKLKTPGPNPLVILDSSGKYEPGEGGWLSVSFEPTMEMTYQGTLIFRFHMNPNKLTIPVLGHGVLPHVHTIGPKVSFPPTLPWSETTEIFFGLTNPCPFPIEVIVPHKDEKWREEEEIFQLLYKYYNKPEEMLVPAIKPEVWMPQQILDFYNTFKTNVRKTLEEQAASMKAASGKSGTKKGKSPKSQKNTAKEKDTKESPRKFRTDAEIIADEIRLMKESGVDPLRDCLNSIVDPPQATVTDNSGKGYIFLLHGSPGQEIHCKETAYSLAMRLKLPVISLDNSIINGLCVSECPAKNTILMTINDLYDNLRKNSSTFGGEEEDSFFSNVDEYDVIQRKLELIAVAKSTATPRSKAGEKKKSMAQAARSMSHVGTAGTGVLMFQLDLIQELLTDYFNEEKYRFGFVVESLSSMIVKSPTLVLTTILRSKPSIRNLHLILCHLEFAKWAKKHEEAQREADLLEEQISKPKVYDEEEVQLIIETFEEMDDNEFENADYDKKNVYIQQGLEERRRKFYEKRGVNYDIMKKKETETKGKDTVGPSDSKKKINKKDEGKGKLGADYTTMQAKYNDYVRNVYESLILTANNWNLDEGEISFPLLMLNGWVAGTMQKKSKKKSDTIMTSSEVPIVADRGFPITLIMCPCSNYKEAIVNMFARDPVVQAKLKPDDTFNILESPVIRKEYTVLLTKSMPVVSQEDPLYWLFLDEKPIKKCECNQVTDLNLLDDLTQENVVNILSKWHCVCGKKVEQKAASSQTSATEVHSTTFDNKTYDSEEGGEDFYNYPLPLQSALAVPVNGRRIILEPGDLVRCKYTFSPRYEGNFTNKYYLEVRGWPESRVDITVSGICDLPRLDNRPKKMFENFVRKSAEDQVYRSTYLDDQKRFEFGPIYIGARRVYEESYTIDLKNSSLMKADIEVEFLGVEDVYDLDKDFILLEPGAREKLTISAAPTSLGVHNSLLLFCIKDNPEIVQVSVACTGVTPVVQILPVTKQIDYGKLLLYRREDDRFIVKNDSILPIMWKVRNAEDFAKDFIISQVSGVIPSNENQVVPITYIACNVGVIISMPLIIDIYDGEGRGDPLISDTIYLSAECYDVMIECAFENSNESFLNFGNVKVNSTEYRDMYLLNRGKYSIYYKLKKVKNFPEPALLKSFEAVPESGVIPPMMKLMAIEFSCTPTTSMKLNNVPAYICSLLDGSKEQVVVAQFPVYVTIASFYNTFTLYPLGELNFHIIPLGSGVLREVILNNTSKCPFNYEIIVPKQYRVDPANPPPPPKGKEAKLKVPPIKCGNFLIMNEDNLLAPGASRTIQIQFLATTAKTFEETIHFFVSDTCPAEQHGVPLRLVGTGAMPVLDFWNLANTFRANLIVKTLSDYKVHESSPHCVFVEDSVTLHFFCVNVNNTHCGSVDLYNNGLVPCILNMVMFYQQNTNQEIFSLDKYEMQIDPLMHKRLGIIFSPKALEEYRAVLEINLKLLDNRHQIFKLCLIGEGVIPRINLIKPVLRQHRIAVIHLPVTCLGSVSNEVIRFKNISSVNTTINMNVLQTRAERPVFWLQPNIIKSEDMEQKELVLPEETQGEVQAEMQDEMPPEETSEFANLALTLEPEQVAVITVYFNPINKGKSNCDIKFKIMDNPFEYFTVLCEAEAFSEDVILIGLKMLSMDLDLESIKGDGTTVSTSTTDSNKKKSKSAPMDKRRTSIKRSSKDAHSATVLKYVLDFGGCELCTTQKRSVVMLNNSEKVYKFTWETNDYVVFKPCVGYISPAEEKDIEIIFFSVRPVNLRKELLSCTLMAVSDDTITIDANRATWDSRLVKTTFNHITELSLNERQEVPIEEEPLKPPEFLGFMNIVILYSVITEYSKFKCDLPEEKVLQDTFIYQKESFNFEVENTGTVPLKIVWSFRVDDDYPSRIDKGRAVTQPEQVTTKNAEGDGSQNNAEAAEEKQIVPEGEHASKETLFDVSLERESVDTWFEVDLPFTIEPVRECLKPGENTVFTVTFRPLEAFNFRVWLISSIDNLDPYDQNIKCRITAMSMIPYVYLDMEDSDYLTAGRRKAQGVVLPPHIKVLEFNVLGQGCYKKTIQVINLTSSGYEFIISASDKSRKNQQQKDEPQKFIPVHCNKLKGFVEGGTSTDVTFTFAPTAPGTYESQWKFMITKHSVTIPILVVGIVREPDVVFVPTIVVVKNSIVGFLTENVVKLKNNEDQALTFEFQGNSLNDETGRKPVRVDPEMGVIPARGQTQVSVCYKPFQDGPISFKIFCRIQYKVEYLTLCFSALSHLIKPQVTYLIIGNEHVLNYEVVTNIYLEQTASTYERRIPFKIKNDGSATFQYSWNYVCTPVKKYLVVSVEPQQGYVPPGEEVECVLHFTLRTVQVRAYPVTLSISDGPVYHIALFADIKQPKYHFSFREFDFGKCIIGAPEKTYKKKLAFTNDDEEPQIIDIAFNNVPELYVDCDLNAPVLPGERIKIPIFFRPPDIKTYEFKLQFWVNSLCEEIITIRGEGVPLLLNLYEGCEQTFNLGLVKVKEKLVREISVMNHTAVAVEASFFFKDVYGRGQGDPSVDSSRGSSVCLDPNTPGAHVATDEISRVKQVKLYRDKIVNKQIEMDIVNALSSLKVSPSKMTIGPHRKGTVKIQFKPMGIISSLEVQLNAEVLGMVRPLVMLSGSATGMRFTFSQNSLQFGRVRRRGCKILKIMLLNKGDFNSRFWWQPLKNEEFSISPMKGYINAHTDVTFTITYRPINYNPFVKVWASCNIENYGNLEVELYAACVDIGVAQNQTMYIECPVRGTTTDYITVVNPTDETWLVLSELSGPATSSFSTLREFQVEANKSFEIPLHFKPKTMGSHDVTVLYSPLGETALFVTVIGVAVHPNPNEVRKITIKTRQTHTEFLPVLNISENPESYVVSTELVSVSPEPFDGYYEIKYPDLVKVWGEAAATCRLNIICFAPCEMVLKVMFINDHTREYQYYELQVVVEPSQVIGTLKFVSRARESVQRELTVSNPLEETTEFHVECEKLFLDEEVSIGRNSETKLTLTYSPLVVGKFEDYLTIENYLVGTYMYRVLMECTPAKEKFLEFSTTLGTNIPIRLRVHNKSDTTAHFLANVDHPSITLDKDYVLPPFEKGKFNVWFEPTELGVQNIRVVFTSSVAGEFVFNVKGTGKDPKPQGPYELSPGGYTIIKFKNVFVDTRVFRIFVDREDFYVKSTSETLKPKAEVRVQVYMVSKPKRGWSEPPSGCLTIEPFDPSEPKVQWTYFLQGKL